MSVPRFITAYLFLVALPAALFGAGFTLGITANNWLPFVLITAGEIAAYVLLGFALERKGFNLVTVIKGGK